MKFPRWSHYVYLRSSREAIPIVADAVDSIFDQGLYDHCSDLRRTIVPVSIRGHDGYSSSTAMIAEVDEVRKRK